MFRGCDKNNNSSNSDNESIVHTQTFDGGFEVIGFRNRSRNSPVINKVEVFCEKHIKISEACVQVEHVNLDSPTLLYYTQIAS